MDKHEINKLLEDGLLAYRHGNKDLALKQFRKAIKKSPHEYLPYRFLATTEYDLGRAEDAIDHLNKAIRLAPEGESGPLEDLSLIKMQLGRQEEAESILQKAILVNPNSLDAHLRLGASLITCGRASEAIAIYTKALEIGPKNFQALYGLSHAYLENSNFEEAISTATQALEVREEDPATLTILGVAHYQKENYSEAKRHLSQSVALNGTDQNTLVHLGRTELKLENFDQAIAIFEDASKHAVNSSILFSQLANALSASGKPAEAVEVCDQYLKTHPLSASLMQVKACALRDLQKFDESEQILGQADLVIAKHIEKPHKYQSLADFNLQLEKMIYEHPTYSRSHSNRATRNGLQTGSLMVDPSPTMREFILLINKEVKERIKELKNSKHASHPWVANAPNDWDMNSWAIVLSNQGHQLSHIHPEAWLSGVYYVKIPKNIVTDNYQGWIEFGEVTDQLYHEQKPPPRLIKPEEGMMVTFPSHSFHKVRQFESHEPRISISFDLFVKQTNEQ